MHECIVLRKQNLARNNGQSHSEGPSLQRSCHRANDCLTLRGAAVICGRWPRYVAFVAVFSRQVKNRLNSHIAKLLRYARSFATLVFLARTSRIVAASTLLKCCRAYNPRWTTCSSIATIVHASNLDLEHLIIVSKLLQLILYSPCIYYYAIYLDIASYALICDILL